MVVVMAVVDALTKIVVCWWEAGGGMEATRVRALKKTVKIKDKKGSDQVVGWDDGRQEDGPEKLTAA